MATYSGETRQGLPRVPGGDPWPAGGVAAVADAPAEPVAAEPMPLETREHESVTEASPAAPVAGVTVRRGLPRVAGGEPWPPERTVAVVATPAVTLTQTSPTSEAVPSAAAAARHTTATPKIEAATQPVNAAAPAEFVASKTPLRRGLPRTPGGDPWPAEGFAPATAAAQTTNSEELAPVGLATKASQPAPAEQTVTTTRAVEDQPLKAQPSTTEPVEAPAVAQASATPTATSTPSLKPRSTPKREPVMIRDKALAHWVRLGIFGVIGAIVAAGILVLAARGLTTLPGVPEWLERYPGEYALPETAEPGFPWWARWSHALNIFLIVLIIRSGLLVRTQQQPPAFFTPKRGGKKISINLWLHTSLDVVWLVNGVVFVVLLFMSGHWMRIVPTSWEVFPNALSAMLQYMTLDWPAEHGWVNYNSLQQIMYFLIVFVAAPLAVITGVRMSEWWPEHTEKLNKFYPAPLARALHFPTMLFFVLFILVHVFLVFSTGALRNLNHMFAGTDVVNWTGFWLFALAIFLTAAGWVAARPIILAPIAGIFGKVSNR